MAARTPKSILIAVLLWGVILAAVAAVVRYLIVPYFVDMKQESLAQQTGSAGKYRHAVTVAADSFSGYCVLRSPEMADRLSQQGIMFQVVDDGADYMKRITALRDGDVDLAVFPINSLIQTSAQLGEFPASIIYVIDETTGADAIVANKEAVAGVRDLNDAAARIVLTPDSPSEFLARVMIASFSLPRLPEKKWMVAADGAAEVYRKFRGDSGRRKTAYALWEPYVAKALEDDSVHVILDSSKIRGYIVDVLVARREYLVDHFDEARHILEAYARTVYGRRSTMQGLIAADAKASGDRLSAAAAARMEKGILWKNTLENYGHFGLVKSGTENIEDIIIKITDVLVKTGALPSDPLAGQVSSLYFDRLVKAMQANKFHPGREVNVISGMDLDGSDETVRGAQQLRELSDAEWARLVTVGDLQVKPIQFGRASDRVGVQSRHDLAALAARLRSWPQYYLQVTGQARPGGDADAALQLARARAEAVVSRLEESGVARARMRPLAKIAAADSVAAQSVVFTVGQLPY